MPLCVGPLGYERKKYKKILFGLFIQRRHLHLLVQPRRGNIVPRDELALGKPQLQLALGRLSRIRAWVGGKTNINTKNGAQKEVEAAP